MTLARDTDQSPSVAAPASEERYREALQATQAALIKTQALYRVSSSLVSAKPVDPLLQDIVDAIAEALSADRVNFFALDVKRRAVTGNYRGGPGAEPIVEIGFDELLEGLAGWVLRERICILSPGNVLDPRESSRVQERRRTVGAGSMVVAPIIYGDEPLGVIVVSNQLNQPEFEQTDVDLLSAMASQSAIAIESASIREQLRVARVELEDRVALRTAEVAEREERYRRITESVTDYVFRVTFEHGRAAETHHGPGSVAVTGYSPGDFATDPGLWLRMVVEEDREAVLEQAGNIEVNRPMRPVEHRIVRKDGTVRWVRSTPVPQYSSDGLLVGYDGLIQDITERRALQEQLAQAQKLQSIGRLAGGVAHDFNNLLTAILGNAELALLDLDPAHPARLSIDEIVKAAERAASLTRQLLAFARKQIIEPVPLDLSSVVSGSIQMLRRLLGEDIEITVVLDEGLGVVEADPGQMQQLLVNLTVNARDAMPEGGTLVIETANVVVADEYLATHPEVSPGRYVTLSVTDTGTGMSEEVRAHLFEPFFTTKPPGKGTGLGLATCHGIVSQSGGHIWVHSDLGDGTTVTILLPQSKAVLGSPSEITAPQPPAMGTETVLVVEDDPSVRRLVVLGLRSHGYVPLEAANAMEALELATAASTLDMLVSDVIMPGMRGPELAARLQEGRPAMRLLLMSGHTETSEAFRDAGGRAIQLLVKPFTPERLARKVREVLDCDR
jgi:PAS domain S-box-containing protein